MTEEQIERHVEYRTDELDKAFMEGLLNQMEYDAGIRGIDRWAERAFSVAKSFPAE
jgi:hypothetical protein